jgi:signal transduction histidine kinase
LAVTREALSNVARHAAATRVSVDLETADGHLSLRVADNGRGVGDDVTRRSGLGNVADRAGTLGGSSTITPGEDGGTLLTWRIPLDEAEAP